MSENAEQQLPPGISPEELVEAVQEMVMMAEEEALKLEQERLRLLESLGNDIDGKLSDRMGRRKMKEAQWLEAQRLYLGSLSNRALTPTEKDPFKTIDNYVDNRKPEVNIIRVKCDAAASQTIAYQFAAGDKNWDINPPSVPEASYEEVQQASQAAGREVRPEEIGSHKANLMSAEIQYHLNCSRYPQEARVAMKDRVVLGTGIMKKPLNSSKLKKTYAKTQLEDGKVLRVPVFSTERVPEVRRVNPWYFFPDDSVTDIRKCEDSIEVHLKSRTEMKELLQRPDFMQDQLQKVLQDEPKEYSNSPFNDPAFLTEGGNTSKNRYTLIEYHGPLTKKMLDACGCDSPNDYERFAEVWAVNGTVIKVELSNLEGCEEVPYCVSVWEPDPASIFGFGIPMLARDGQRVVNETYKMMLDNAGISAGPQVIVDTTLITPADGGLECTPFKVWYSTEYGADLSKAITFFTPPNAYEGLSSLFGLAKQLADEESSIPLLLSGLGLPTGAGDSATGMALMNQNATSPLFYKSEEWDDDITEPLITAMYDWEMQFNPKEEIKGSYEIDVRTSTSYLRNTQDMQKLQALRQEIAQGSPVGEWVNMDELTQVTLMGMRLPYSSILKSPEQVEQERANAQPPPPDPNLMKAETDRMRLELDKERLQLEREIAQVKAAQEERLADIQAEVQFNTNQTRMAEARAQVIKAQYDYESAMAAVASKDEQARMQILAKADSEEMQRQTQLFLAGMEAASKERQAMNKAGGTNVRPIPE